MTREMFLAELRQRLAGLPREELEERLAFYREMLDDRLEDGLTEEEAAASLGTPEEVAAQVLAEIPMSVLVREKVKPKKKANEKPWGWETILIILGFPIWFSVLIAVLAAGFSLYVCLWAVVISLWAVAVSLAAGAVACLAGTALYLYRGDPGAAGCALGGVLVCAGLALLWTAACAAVTKGAAGLTKGIWLDIKTLLGRKGRGK